MKVKIGFLFLFSALLILTAVSCSVHPFGGDSYTSDRDGSLITMVASTSSTSSSSSFSSYPAQFDGINFLANQMDQYHSAFGVFLDPNSGGNNFDYYAYMGTVPSTMLFETNVVKSGTGSLKVTINYSAAAAWAGYYFMNGVLTGSARQPSQNWGTIPNAGVNLTGVTKLTFWARTDSGSFGVEFFVAGIGRDPNTGLPNQPYPDSSPKVTIGTVTLTTTWQQYTIWLTNKNMSYVLGGFGWAAAQQGAAKIFYLDDIKYDLIDTTSLRLLNSYVPNNTTNDVDRVLANTAYVYDNALALMSFVIVNNQARAKMIADSFVYAQDNDRYYTDGRIRNAYKSGRLVLQPGWYPGGKTNTVAMPGWWDVPHYNWYEDKFCVSTATGNVAWVMLALLNYYQKYGGAIYLNTVKELGEWVETNVRDTRGAGGYMGGFEGWEPGPENPGGPTALTYKSTEHNLDLYAAFQRLYVITGETKWQTRAAYARNFALSMWDAADFKFLTGTANDGVTRNYTPVPTDCQSWTMLAMKLNYSNFYKGLLWAEVSNRVPNTWGFDFNSDKDGIWYEGTAQMASGYMFYGYYTQAQNVLDTLTAAKDAASGGWFATSTPSLTTGFWLSDGSAQWLYFRRLHVGATAWANIALNHMNPFWNEQMYLPPFVPN